MPQGAIIRRINKMTAGNNERCVKGSEESRQKAKITKERLEENNSGESQYLEAISRADRAYQTEW